MIDAEFRPRCFELVVRIADKLSVGLHPPKLVNIQDVPLLTSNISHSLSSSYPVTDEVPLFVDLCIAQLSEDVNTDNLTTLVTYNWTGWRCNLAALGTKASA